MRAPRFVAVAIGCSACVALATPAADARSPVLELGRAPRADLVRARELDAQGARAYREARVRDALFLFTEAYRLGGPSLELWNVARCHERLDEPDDAAEVLGRYLEADDLSYGDRTEATRELGELRRKPSMMIVDSSLAGAAVLVDGRRAGVAPVAVEIAPGKHLVRIEGTARARDVEVEARFGKPLVLRAADDVEEPAVAEIPVPTARRLELDAQGGIYAHELGAVPGRVGPGLSAGARFGIGSRSLIGFLALRGELFGFGWSSASAPPTLAECTLPDRYQATGLAGTAGGGFAWDASRFVRASLDLGVGAEGMFVGKGGGDVLVASCSPSPGVVPTFGARAAVSFRVAGGTRLVLTPLSFAVHPAYDDASSSPRDATRPWFRFGATLGFGYDVGL